MFPLTTTPDGDDAQSLVTEELSRAEYGEYISPITRLIRTLLEYVQNLLRGRGGDMPIEVVLIIGVIIFLVVAAIVVIRNPLARRVRSSSTAVFSGDVSLDEAMARAEEARRAGDRDEAFTWLFRVLVLRLDEHQVVVAGPGLTAHEVATAAGAALPQLAAPFAGVSDTFDRIHYGDSHATPQDITAVDALVSSVTQMRRSVAPGDAT